VTAEEFAGWLNSLVEQRRLERGAANELVEARRVFDQQREQLFVTSPSRVIGVAAGEVLHADSVPELLATTREMGSLVYFERADEELISFDDLERLR